MGENRFYIRVIRTTVIDVYRRPIHGQDETQVTTPQTTNITVQKLSITIQSVLPTLAYHTHLSVFEGL